MNARWRSFSSLPSSLPSLRSLLIVTAPLVSIGTLMVGLRIGAGSAFRAATVFTAPPGKPFSASGPAPFSWQVVTYLEDQGVREVIAIDGLSVVVRSKGQESRWTGKSNADGIAEPHFELANVAEGDPIEVEVRTETDKEPLARGTVTWSSRTEVSRIGSPVRPSRRDGSIPIDLFVEGGRLVTGFETPLWARMHASVHTAVHLEPEAGLRLQRQETEIECGGWAKILAIAEGHVTGLQIEAKGHGEQGIWFGALPVAAGAFFIDAPRFIGPGAKQAVTLVAPNPRTVVYAEVDDERGRVYAAALPVAEAAGDPIPKAHLELPPLADGLHWLVVSGEPRGAENLGGATIAKPFLVGEAADVHPTEECSIGPWLAQHPAIGFPRTMALDGMATRGAANRARHRLGLFIGLASLLSAAILELLLLTAAAREARAALQAAELDDENKVTHEAGDKRGLVIALLVAILGFALLAILLIAKG